MPVELNILHLEDNPLDVELAEEKLKAEGFQCRFTHVDNRDDFVAALKKPDYDLILADYAMPGFDGLTALSYVRQKDLGIPFILLSGTVGEELAIKSLKNGATDYVLKDRMERLAPVIRRAMQEAKERDQRNAAEEALLHSERRFRALIENSSDAISLLNAKGKLVYVSPSTERILGYLPEETIGLDPVVLVHPDDMQATLNVLQEVFQNPQKIFLAQYRMRHKQGQWVWIESAINNLLLEPSVQAVVFNFRDISERKKNEEILRSREAHQAALNAIISAGTRTNTVQSEFLQAVLQHTLTAFNLKRGMIWITAGEEAVIGLPDSAAKEFRINADDPDNFFQSTVATNDWLAVKTKSSDKGTAYLMKKYGVRADMVTPLLRESEHIGGLSVMSDQPRSWSQQEIDLMGSIGAQLGTVAQRVRLFEEIQNRVNELEAINRISTALRTEESIDKTFPQLLNDILGILHTDRGSIWLQETMTDKLRMVEQRGMLEGYPSNEVVIQAGQGVAGLVFISGEVYRFADFREEYRLASNFKPYVPAGISGVAVPIRTSTHVIGVIVVGVKKPRTLSESEIKLLTTMTEITGNSIQRMLLYNQTERQLQHLVSLRTIDIAISSSFDLRFTLNILLDQVRDQLDVDAADIMLLNPRLQVLEYATGRGFITPIIEKSHVRLGEGLSGRAALERKTISLPDYIQENTGYTRNNLVVTEKFSSYYVTPLIVKGQVKGVLEIYQHNPLNPGPEWIEFMDSLAGQAAIAIENHQLFESLQRSNTELALAYDATIEGWSRALDLRDKETEGHTQRVTELTIEMARFLGFNENEMVSLRWGALLHDIGKMGVPDHILHKPGPLTDEEWVIMRKHPIYAYEMISPIAYLRSSLDIPYCHHEKWDGSGYPRGLSGEAIPLAARIFAVIDVWDALSSDRPYRPAWPEEKVRAYIQENRGTHFDPQIAKTFLELKKARSD